MTTMTQEIFDAAQAVGWTPEQKPGRMRLLTSSAVEYGRDMESRFVNNVTPEQLAAMHKAGKLGWKMKSVEFEKTTDFRYPITVVLTHGPRQLLRIKPDGTYRR